MKLNKDTRPIRLDQSSPDNSFFGKDGKTKGMNPELPYLDSDPKIIRTIFEKSLDIKKLSGDTFTFLDLYNSQGLSQSQIEKIIFTRLGMDRKPNKAEAIITLNKLWKSSLEHCQNTLYRKVPRGFTEKTWSSFDEFVEHIKEHTDRVVQRNISELTSNEIASQGAYSLFFCGILKLMLVAGDVLDKPQTQSLEYDFRELFKALEKSKFLQRIPQKKKKDSPQDDIFKLTVRNGKDKYFEVGLEGRPKSLESILLKELFSRSYTSLNKFRDLLALRFRIVDHTENGKIVPPEEYLQRAEIIRGIRDIVYPRRKLSGPLNEIYEQICNQGGTPALFEVKGDLLNQEAIDHLASYNIIVRVKDGKNETDKSYVDGKFVTGVIEFPYKDSEMGEQKISIPVGNTYITGKPLSPEIQIVLDKNKNERGFSNHKIYDLKKIITANARLFGMLSFGSLEYIIDNFAKDIMDKESILHHLLYDTPPFFVTFKSKNYCNKHQNNHPHGYYFMPRSIFEGELSGSEKKIKHARTTLQKIYPELISPLPSFEGMEEIHLRMDGRNPPQKTGKIE